VADPLLSISSESDSVPSPFLVFIPCHLEPDVRFSLIRLSDNLLPGAFKVSSALAFLLTALSVLLTFAYFRNIPLSVCRRVLHGCVSRFFAASVAFTMSDRLDILFFPFRATFRRCKTCPELVEGFTLCYGLLLCSFFSKGYNASAAADHWLPATWPPDSYHDQTCTG